MKLKKLIIIFIAIVEIICVSTVTHVIAVNNLNSTENAENIEIQNVLNAIPEQVQIDIPEIEYEKRKEVTQTAIEKILEEKQISLENVTVKVESAFRNYVDIYAMTVQVETKNEIENEVQRDMKEFNLIYNNTYNKNADDFEYIKYLKIQKADYFIYDYGDKNSSVESDLNKYYKNQISDESITMKIIVETIGSWWFNKSAGAEILLFKDGILYDKRNIEPDIWISQFKVPSDIEDDKMIDYVVNYIYEDDAKTLEPELSDIKIEKGTDDKEIKNGYTITYRQRGLALPRKEYIIITKEEKTNTKAGDISGDGVVDTDDARNILLYCIGNEKITDEQKLIADVNKDGFVDAEDARKILLYCIGQGEI